MYLEIEAKLRVESLEAVAQRLAQCGAKSVATRVQIDCYYDAEDRRLTQTDRCLRLRTERTGERERLILTYKGPKQKDDFKKREEVNLMFSDVEAVERLVEGLGFRRTLAFNKRRSIWDLEGCEVALDELPLIGAFVEIEGPDAECIARVRETLGLKAASHVTESYASLVEQELARQGLGEREVFL